MDRGMGKPAGGGEVRAAAATPYPQRATAPSAPADLAPRSPAPAPHASGGRATLRGFVRDGVVHLLDGGKLPENSFVKILPE
jgi:ribonuclease HI